MHSGNYVIFVLLLDGEGPVVYGLLYYRLRYFFLSFRVIFQGRLLLIPFNSLHFETDFALHIHLPIGNTTCKRYGILKKANGFVINGSVIKVVSLTVG